MGSYQIWPCQVAQAKNLSFPYLRRQSEGGQNPPPPLFCLFWWEVFTTDTIVYPCEQNQNLYENGLASVNTGKFTFQKSDWFNRVTIQYSCERSLRELSLIMTGRGVEAFQKILRKISSPHLSRKNKNSNPIKISKNNFRPQNIIKERKHSHSSSECLSFYLPLSDSPRSVSVSVAYTSFKDIQ